MTNSVKRWGGIFVSTAHAILAALFIAFVVLWNIALMVNRQKEASQYDPFGRIGYTCVSESITTFSSHGNVYILHGKDHATLEYVCKWVLHLDSLDRGLLKPGPRGWNTQ